MNICMQKIGMHQVPFTNKSIQSIVGATWFICEKLIVLGHKTQERDGYTAMIMGFGQRKISKINKPQRYLSTGYAEGFGPQKVYEWRTDELMPIGSEVSPEELFTEGSLVDVRGYTKGRGFSGVMKVHNFHGGRASHGASKSHRTPGSSGGKRAEGRVMKGKKMPKRYGNTKVTIKGVQIVYAKKTNLLGKEVSLIAINGAGPGCNLRLCYLKKGLK